MSIARTVKTAIVGAALMPALTLAGTTYDNARVVAVEPLYETVSYEVPRQQCEIERVPYRSDGYRQSATVPILGAIIGGAVGNAVGHHKRNKQVGTAVGAILGGSIGADIARRNGQYDRVSYREQEVCRVVNDIHEEERLLGYRVTYRYAGETYTTRMDRDPGPTLRVRVNVAPA